MYFSLRQGGAGLRHRPLLTACNDNSSKAPADPVATKGSP